MARETFMIVDGNALLHRAWHALPPLHTPAGELVNAVYGFLMIVMKALKDIKPSFVAVAFDMPGPTFRHKQYAAYKATREKKPDEFYAQFARAKELLSLLGIRIFEQQGFEADDVIATLVSRTRTENPATDIMIITGDQDAFQLIDEKTRVCSLKKGFTDTNVFDVKAVEQQFGGLRPSQLTAYKALRGDPTDNIKGVSGIGEKTAQQLIREFGTLENLYDRLPATVLSERMKEKLCAQKEVAFESLSLVQLRVDVPLEFSFSDCRIGAYHQRELVQRFQELGFKSLLARLNELPGFQNTPSLFDSTARSTKNQAHYHILTAHQEIDEFLSILSKQKKFAFDTETTSLDSLHAQLVGISISFQEKNAWYIPWSALNADVLQALKKILEDGSIGKVGHNSKYDCEALRSADISVQGLICDTMLAAYVLNPGVREYSLDTLTFTEFGYQKIPITSLIGEGKEQRSMADVPLSEVGPYACEDADFTWRLHECFVQRLEKEGLRKLFETIEMPLIPVLIAMETQGMCIDSTYLKKLSRRVSKELKHIQETIFVLAGEEFNLNSPIQLKKILFGKLAIPSFRIRKGKTGLSTAASELEKMKHLHPIIPAIMEYREYAKLLNTYIDVLPELVDPKTKRVHTSFNQTIASTGRLSSSNPNVQNIPIRTELGNEIRRCFVAPEGHVLLRADYSQMELRIVASLANDIKMIEAFANGVDIHAATAAEIHGVALSDVTPSMRRAAKEINFGVLYGMGPQGLSESAGISYGEAELFIEKYFVVYPAVRSFLDETVAHARTQGYVETFFGRRRYVPDLSSSQVSTRNAGLRMAVNMPIQGTAADVMKLAMIRIHALTKKKYPSLRMLLQVHDELLFEIPKDTIEEYAPLIRREMESVVPFRAPLLVDMRAGKNWGELHPV